MRNKLSDEIIKSTGTRTAVLGEPGVSAMLTWARLPRPGAGLVVPGKQLQVHRPNKRALN